MKARQTGERKVSSPVVVVVVAVVVAVVVVVVVVVVNVTEGFVTTYDDVQSNFINFCASKELGKDLLLPIRCFEVDLKNGSHVFQNGPIPASFCLFSVFSKRKFYRKKL